MEKITTDISAFGNLRKDGSVYEDKTDLLWRLVANVEGRESNLDIDEPVFGRMGK